MTDTLATWLYAVTAAPEDGTPPQGLTGVADEPVRLVEGAGLAAVVGSVPLADFDEDALRGHLEDLEWLERTARAHHRVINGAARHGQVIPLRFATLYHDDDRSAPCSGSGARTSRTPCGGWRAAPSGASRRMSTPGRSCPTPMSPRTRGAPEPPI
ncbi:hypothetical protein SMALA_6984 [Streptomyces malaysiensis subsp. malaysiensis]|nr:hypothetical protein SMALA_6984 [Streptomyces malaysiensis]